MLKEVRVSKESSSEKDKDDKLAFERAAYIDDMIKTALITGSYIISYVGTPLKTTVYNL